MSIVTLYLQAPIAIPRLVHVGGGDADVYAKSGRSTHVSVVTLNPTVHSNRTTVGITTVYEVREGRSNYTHLRGETTVSVQAETGLRILQIGPGGRNANFNESFGGEDHDWHDISSRPGISGSYLKNLSIRFDGKGDDDRGNAQLRGIVEVPVTVEIEEESSTLPFKVLMKKLRIQGLSPTVPV